MSLVSYEMRLTPGKHMLLLDCPCSQGYSIDFHTDYSITPSLLHITRPSELKVIPNITTGMSPIQNCNEWRIWLRKVIPIKEETKIEFNLHISHYDVIDYVHLILADNDTSEITQFPLLRTQPFTLQPNNKGYTIIVYAYNDMNPLPSTPYELTILTDKPLQKVYYNNNI